jgi:hypothetical protein
MTVYHQFNVFIAVPILIQVEYQLNFVGTRTFDFRRKVHLLEKIRLVRVPTNVKPGSIGVFIIIPPIFIAVIKVFITNLPHPAKSWILPRREPTERQYDIMVLSRNHTVAREVADE